MSPQYTEITISAASAAFSAIAGMILSHPFDRASFLAAKHKRTFWTFENFRHPHPYQGFVQASTHKTFMGTSTYFLLLDQITQILNPYLVHSKHDPIAQKACIALGVGAAHGILSIPLLTVKSYTWSAPQPKKYWIQNAWTMFQAGGIRPFFRGSPAIIARDAINAVIYEYVRLSLKKQEKETFLFQYAFLCDMLGSMCAVTCSSIFNYVRQHQLAVPPQTPTPSSRTLISQLWQESKTNPTAYTQSIFIIKRLQIPIGLLRFGLLIPIFQETYLYCKKEINQYLKENSSHTPKI